ncbi:MAG: hypothetical protein JWO59_3194 [Chloroflexi bacterium]|nr:hypothetical protein [Chloroflexota bacterium]
MGTNDGAIDEMEVPVHPTGLVSLLLQRGQDAVPNAGRTPAVEPARDRFVTAVAFRQILPGSPGAQDPLDAIENRTMVVIGPPSPGFLGRQQGRQPRPLLISKVIAMHTSSLPKFADRL